MPRTATGNLAQRTLLDEVNRHPLTVERVRAGGSPFTIRRVQRLGSDGLAPNLLKGDDVNPLMVEHFTALLCARSPGRGQWKGLLPLKLAVDGHSMLPECVKSGVLTYLDALTQQYMSDVDTFDTDDDVVTEVSGYRTSRAVSDRKRPRLYQVVANNFRDSGFDKDYVDEAYNKARRYRTRDDTDAVVRDAMNSISNGGRFADPVLAAQAFKAMTGVEVDERAFKLRIPSMQDISDWVRGRPWDDRITAFMRFLNLGRTLLPNVSTVPPGSDPLVANMMTSVIFVMISDRNQSITLSTINDLVRVIGQTSRLDQTQ